MCPILRDISGHWTFIFAGEGEFLSVTPLLTPLVFIRNPRNPASARKSDFSPEVKQPESKTVGF
jgi:hypothetical protein